MTGRPQGQDAIDTKVRPGFLPQALPDASHCASDQAGRKWPPKWLAMLRTFLVVRSNVQSSAYPLPLETNTNVRPFGESTAWSSKDGSVSRSEPVLSWCARQMSAEPLRFGSKHSPLSIPRK